MPVDAKARATVSEEGVSRVDSAAVLLGNLIDYAGLFPPASLAMAPAVANYDSYSRSEFGWILGRFIVPAARLDEFGAAASASGISHEENTRTCYLSALVGPDVAGDFARVSEFNAGRGGDRLPFSVQVESVEVRVATAADVEAASKIICADMETYFEIPLSPGGAASSGARDCVAAVATCGRRAKVRTGGETADKFPSPEALVEFIELCASAQVAFKATAGLHHPLRSRQRLTYQPDSPTGIMHGFLNVFLAAAFLRAGLETKLAVDLLQEQLSNALRFDSNVVTWRGHRLDVLELAASREHFSISFGSCSFSEPIDDLRSLGLL